MSELTPDAACEAIRALQGLSEWTRRRFVAYARKRFSHRKRLLAQLLDEPPPDSKDAIVKALVEHGFFRVLRLKVERDRLPASGPAVTPDELYPCAGVLIAPFVGDLEGIGALKAGATERAKRWRPRGLHGTDGALRAALAQAFEDAGVPGQLAGGLVPIIGGTVEGMPLLHLPADDGSPKAELLRVSGIVAELRRVSNLPEDRLFRDDDRMRELLRRLGPRSDFEMALDERLFSVDADRDRLADEAAHAGMEALVACDPASAPDVGKAFDRLRGQRADGRAVLIAYGAFLREEFELTWGKDA